MVTSGYAGGVILLLGCFPKTGLVAEAMATQRAQIRGFVFILIVII